MKIFIGLNHSKILTGTATTIGNFDGLHRGHQAMLALLKAESAQRKIPSCVITFEPHPRDYFAELYKKPQLAPSRVATFRDKLQDIRNCGIDQVIVLPFNAQLAGLSHSEFVRQILVEQLNIKFILVGNDFMFGNNRLGNYSYLDQQGDKFGFEVSRMNSYDIHGERVSSTAVRTALAAGDMRKAARLLGHPYCISGHVVHGRKLGRELGFNTLNQRFRHWKPATSGIFVAKVHGVLGLNDKPRAGVANLGIRPSIDPNDINGGQVLLETHVLDWPTELATDAEVYGQIIRVELLHKLHDELRYPSLQALKDGIQADSDAAQAWWDQHADLLC